MRKIIAGLLLALGITAAAAQAPPPVPALPDTPRLTTYSISGTTCACAVGFQLYADSTDVANWIQVWVNGVQVAQPGNWMLSSPTGSLATIPRPITDAVLTFTAAQTGTVQIVGARRPRRLSQFGQNVAARDLNQAITTDVADNREQWDALLRAITVPPGDTAPSLLLPSVSTRASKFLGFDATGAPAVFTPGVGGGGNVVGSGSSVNGNLPCYSGTSGLAILDCGVGIPIPLTKGGTGQATVLLARGSAGLNVDQYTAHGDSIYSIAATDRTVGTNAALTAPRIWTLPAANAVNPGQTIVVADYAGGVTAANTLTVARAGADTFAGGTTTSTAVIAAQFGRLDFRSDGVSKWSVSTSTAAAGSVASLQLKTPVDYGALCDGTTDDSTAIAAWLVGISGNAYVGWGLNGRTCIWNGLIPISSGTTLLLNQMTLKLKNSGNANSSFVCGPTTELGGPITGLTIRDGIFEGNRVNQTNALGGSLLQCISAVNVYIENTYFQNARGDGLFIGGTTNAGGQGKSRNVTLLNVHAIGNYRNGLTIDGVDEMSVFGGFFDTTTNTNNNGPQCGIDAEPDDANGTNTNVGLWGVSASANGDAGFAATGGSGVCVFGANANTSNLTIWGPKGNSNKNYVVDTFSAATGAQVRLHGSGGLANGVGIYHSTNIVDWLPITVVKGAASGCGVGFSCIGVPN